jgi:hypothetical protein
MGGETWLEGTTTPSLPVPNDTTQRLASGNLLVRKMDVGLTNRCKRRRSASPNVGSFHNFVQPSHSWCSRSAARLNSAVIHLPTSELEGS